MELLKKVKETINKYSMFSEGDRVLIGFSGGPDSVCLAVILDKLKKDFNLSLYAVYVDHGLRPDEVENEKKFCREFCDKLGIIFFCESVDVGNYARQKGLNKQEAARDLRYKVYEEIAGRINATKVALGHNADDQAETLLMMLLRGSGRKGLSGIPPVRKLELGVRSQESGVKKDKLIIRPLIEIERKEIEEFLLQKKGDSQIATTNSELLTLNSKLPFMVDSSNLKNDYFRNWIRLSVIHELKKKNPALIRNICRTMDILREEDDYLEIIVTKTLIRLISRKSDVTIELFLSPLETVEKPILRRVLRRAIDATDGLRGISLAHIEDIIGLIKTGKSGDRVYLPKDIRVIRDYSVLKITSVPPVKIEEHEITPPCEIVIREAGIKIKALFEEEGYGPGDNKYSVLLDAGTMIFPLKVRHRTEGDFFYPHGFGKKKKLQDYFVDEKVPRDERDSVPILVSGNDIVWVAGYRTDERFKVTNKTEKFLRIIISKL
ncbi:MAG: tRNA lysidine(34) synthetase TilS [Nitrospirae bacterium]|nr:tRNA lysidine(34) synthetase TilS [Nitrospirota bacterium]